MSGPLAEAVSATPGQNARVEHRPLASRLHPRTEARRCAAARGRALPRKTPEEGDRRMGLLIPQTAAKLARRGYIIIVTIVIVIIVTVIVCML